MSARSLDKWLCFLPEQSAKGEEMIKLLALDLEASRVSHPRSHPDEADCSTAAALVSFQDKFRQWERSTNNRRVPKTEVDNFGYYLPHRPVMKQASQTMKIRPVFDASARDKSQPSHNDCLNRSRSN
ncbi:integrase catalytic domain-containing protein [Trichonephila clavipes]|nr:integrase catalytic domain-containing protein [Trichonephila clavipes]